MIIMVAASKTQPDLIHKITYHLLFSTMEYILPTTLIYYFIILFY